jgi:CDP-diacylglycerol--serine O-phosphatidyltransferase
MNKRRIKKRREIRRGVYLLPNLLTTGCLCGGFYAIIATFNGRYFIATVAIFIAFIFDGIDGRVARLTRTTSRFGVEYDSLADLVAFGVAPALLAFSWALQPWGRWGWLAAFLYVACGALRLARFNVQVDTAEPREFRGLPIPMAASLMASTYLLFRHLGVEPETKHISVLLMTYALALLMVSRVPYPSFKKVDLFKRKPFSALVVMVVTLVVVLAEPSIMLFVLSALYLVLGPANAVRGWYAKWYAKRAAAWRGKKTQPLMR